jgi:hypothetical protein
MLGVVPTNQDTLGISKSVLIGHFCTVMQALEFYSGLNTGVASREFTVGISISQTPSYGFQGVQGLASFPGPTFNL